MKNIVYNIPTTLLREKEILIAKCDLLIEAFNSLCKDETARIQEEKKRKKESRK